jgi:hypothetical protein
MKDGKFLDDLPYLLDPWPNSEPPGPLHLTWTSRFKLLGIAGLFVVALVFENWIFARWYHSRKNRRRYL